MGIADRAIFILGLTLAGVITFVLVAGVIVAVIKFFMESNKPSVQIHTVTMLENDDNDEPKAALVVPPLE